MLPSVVWVFVRHRAVAWSAGICNFRHDLNYFIQPLVKGQNGIYSLWNRRKRMCTSAANHGAFYARGFMIRESCIGQRSACETHCPLKVLSMKSILVICSRLNNSQLNSSVVCSLFTTCTYLPVIVSASCSEQGRLSDLALVRTISFDIGRTVISLRLLLKSRRQYIFQHSIHNTMQYDQ